MMQNGRRIDWDSLPLGLKLDREIAVIAGCSVQGVAYARKIRGIAAPEGNSKRGRPWVRTVTVRRATCRGCRVVFEYHHTSGEPLRRACSIGCVRRMGREKRRKVPDDFALLYQMYWDRNMSTIEMAAEFDTDHSVIRVHMVALGIPRRKMGPRQQSTCMIVGCNEAPYKIRHSTNGSMYGRRCLLHSIAHRHHLGSEYWFRVARYRKRNMPAEEDLAAVIARAVPSTLPPDIREEVVQEIALKILLNEIAITDLADAVRTSIKHFYREYQDKFRMVSLDAPLGGDSALTLRDLLGADGQMIKREHAQDSA